MKFCQEVAASGFQDVIGKRITQTCECIRADRLPMLPFSGARGGRPRGQKSGQGDQLHGRGTGIHAIDATPA